MKASDLFLILSAIWWAPTASKKASWVMSVIYSGIAIVCMAKGN